ncbi:outer membrane protein, cobalt-zinc-cadmium efflux system [Chitinophaga eiseniae]|uniref:Outer membrane protein, cobalt-zinc-cadmium efflux system n=1 Tax=Chitinophaga eiseniae TaxID=634771 RepID=A0A1T4N6N7_9BACT|nr:TolC family protein [Chitinophaga eiseniae]SJZ74775.1 outer membrane protein, cobalt-zinc-cadmium efflux system [Chitinophaga eiseniae]
MRTRWLLPLGLLYSGIAAAQEKQLDFSAYLSGVRQHNLGYAAEKFNMDVAAANVLMAKVFPDPEISAGVFDNGQRRMQQGYGFSSSISYTLELGGKRHARMGLAVSEKEVTRYLLEDYFRNLRADATLAFLTAMQLQRLYDMKMEAYRYMWQLSQADSIRCRAGLVPEADARQSRVEAGMLLNEAIGAGAELKAAQVQLQRLMGTYRGDTLIQPVGNMDRFERSFPLQELVGHAQQERADLLAALRQKDVSVKTLQLAKAARMIDLGLTLGVNNATVVTNVVAPTPSMNTVSAGISLPLKFSNRNKGDLLAANAGIQQQEAVYRQTLLQVQTEVTTAWFTYLGAGRQREQFDNGLLQEAKRVLEGRRYSYQRGETSLLEVLNAQRTYNDVQQQYYETIYRHAAALVELERAAAMWDIQF